MSLFISLRSEIFKTKRTASFYLTLVAAAVIPFILLLDITFDGMSPEQGKVVFEKMFTSGYQITGFAIFPMFIVLICTLLPQIEYKNNAWKQVLASPQAKANIFMAKFLNIQFLILVFLIANQLFTFVAATIVHFAKPELSVLHQPINVYKIVVTIINSYLALLAICTIQFWVGVRFKNFIVPIAVGISCWLIGTLLVMEYKSGFAPYFPYSFHIYGMFDDYKAKLASVLWTSAAYAAFFLLAGFFDFRRRKMVG